jgi:type VI secretion system protein ImpA
MATAPLIDFETLLAPIPGDDPAGSSVPFVLNGMLDDHRKEIDPADFDEDDPQRPDGLVKANWPGIVEVTSSTLAEKSKNLKLAARLLEALVKEHGFAGLRDGLTLIRRLVDEAWDRLQPAIEGDDDIEVRAAALYWLIDNNRGALFPNTIRNVVLVGAGDTAISVQKNKALQDAAGRELFAKAIQATPFALCRDRAEDLAAAIEELKLLEPTLSERMGQHAPSLSELKQAALECQVLMTQIVKQRGPDPDSAGQQGEQGAEGKAESSGGLDDFQPGGGGGASVSLRAGASREQLLKTIKQAADQLKAIEPHSPVPYLLEKAVELGEMPFPDLMKALVRNSEVLAALGQELGIRNLDGSESG